MGNLCSLSNKQLFCSIACLHHPLRRSRWAPDHSLALLSAGAKQLVSEKVSQEWVGSTFAEAFTCNTFAEKILKRAPSEKAPDHTRALYY